MSLAYLLIVALVTIGLLIVSTMQIIKSRQRWPALHTLDQRYARGEITREEYLEKRADILEE